MINKRRDCPKLDLIKYLGIDFNCSFDTYDEKTKDKKAWPNSNIPWQQYRSAESTKTHEVNFIFLKKYRNT